MNSVHQIPIRIHISVLKLLWMVKSAVHLYHKASFPLWKCVSTVRWINNWNTTLVMKKKSAGSGWRQDVQDGNGHTTFWLVRQYTICSHSFKNVIRCWEVLYNIKYIPEYYKGYYTRAIDDWFTDLTLFFPLNVTQKKIYKN